MIWISIKIIKKIIRIYISVVSQLLGEEVELNGLAASDDIKYYQNQNKPFWFWKRL